MTSSSEIATWPGRLSLPLSGFCARVFGRSSSGKTEGPHAQAWTEVKRQVVRLMLGAFDERIEPRFLHRDRSGCVAIDRDLDLSPSLNRRVGAAPLVVDLQFLAVLTRCPRLLPRPPREELRSGGDDLCAGGVTWPQWRHWLGECPQGVLLTQLSLDRFLARPVFALAEVKPGERAT